MNACLSCNESTYNVFCVCRKQKRYRCSNVRQKSRIQLLLRITWAALRILLLTNFLIFVCVPFLYKYCYKLQNSFVFLSFVGLPDEPVDDPTQFGLNATRNFYISNGDVKLGVWHILPDSVQAQNDEDYESFLSNGQNVIIYVHGNAGNRGTDFRIELYKILRHYFHVIAYDYRGYGDSTDVVPTEEGIVTDCICVFKWVKQRMNSSGGGAHLFVWGHSLGTSLSANSLSVLQRDGLQPSGLILESPFNNFHDEISLYPMAALFRHLPWFPYTITEPMLANGFTFETDKHLPHVDCPILILHAEDDDIVPYKLGRKLFNETLMRRRATQGFIRMVTFGADRHFAHKYIYSAEELPTIIQTFVQDSINDVQEKKLII